MAVVSADWDKLKDLFGAALERLPDERSTFVREACGEDESLRAELESLLQAHESGSSSLSQVAGSLFTSTTGEPAMEAGRRMGPYKLIRRIGHGGMAAVYLALRADETYRKEVAIKIVSAGLENAEVLRRFRNERQTLAALDHPNIVKLLDAGSTEDGLPYLVMDYVEGKPVDDYCDDQKLSTKARLQLFRPICSAVQYAHQNRVIHRDLKPANVLVSSDGTPRLLDFGIAKLLDSQRLAVTGVMTSANIRPMTPAYASPEQVRGGEITYSSDIYSLAVLLYKLLTGHAPYRLKTHNLAEMEKLICDTDPTKPSLAVTGIEEITSPDGETRSITPQTVSESRQSAPEQLSRTLRGDLDNILLKGLSKDPAQRYESVADFSDDIQRYLDGYPVKARKAALGYRAKKLLRRRRAEAAIAAAVLVLIAIAVFSTFKFTQNRNQAVRVALRAGAALAPGRTSVAVLGFRNLSQRAQSAWMATALSEMLSTELASGEQLRIIPGENVARVKMELAPGDSADLSQKDFSLLRKNLGADYVVIGSYLDLDNESANNLRLDVQLKETAGGTIVSAVSDRGSEAALDDLVMHVGGQLRQKLGAGKVQQSAVPTIKAAMPADPEARALYAEGLATLRLKDAFQAKTLLEKAVAADPGFPLSHSELSQAWQALGYDAKAQQEAQRAYELSNNLSREQKLLVEARYREAKKDWNKAIEIYRTLFDFFPDNLAYGLALAQAQIYSGNTKDAFETISSLHKLPSPQGDDPSITLLEGVAYEHTGDFKHELSIAEQAASAARMRGAKLLLARALYAQGSALGYLGQAGPGTTSVSQGQQIYSQAGDQGAVARGYATMGAILWRGGDSNGAMKMYEKALAINQAIGDKGSMALTLNNISLALSQLGDPAGSEKALRESLALFRETGNRYGEATALVNLAGILYDRADLTQAGKMYDASLALARDVGDAAGAATAQVNLAQIEVQEGYLSKAKQLYNNAFESFRSSDDKSDSAYPLVGLGEIAKYEGDLNSSRRYYQQALAIRTELGEKGTSTETRMALAEISVEEGNLKDAEDVARNCVEEFQKEGDTDNEIFARALLARVLVRQGRLADAKNQVQQANSQLPKTQKFLARAKAVIAASELNLAEGRLATARQELTRLSSEATKHGSLATQFETRLLLGEIEMKSGQSSQARNDFAALEKQARERGFGLVAGKAAASLKKAS